LLALQDLGGSPRVFLALFGAAFAAYLWATFRLETTASLMTVLSVAALLRLLLLPLPASLSDDILRYQWDGRVAVAGFNPYRLAPESAELIPLRDELWRAMPHKEVPSVYPPAALGLFSIASMTPIPAITLKMVISLADLLGCWLLARLAMARGLAPGRAAWYAWNPLVVLEIAGMGHVDGLMVPAMVMTVFMLVRARPGDSVRAGVAAAIGVATKLVPLVALPMWAHQSRQGQRRPGQRRPAWRFLATVAILLLAAIVPVVVSVGGVPPGLVTYGVSWEFNGPIYEPLWRGMATVELDQWVKNRLDTLKERTGRHEQLNHIYPFVYPQLMAKLLLAAAFGFVWVCSLRARDPVRASKLLFGAVILCAATVYPWYLLWVLPWAALERDRAWLTLSATSVFSYLPQHTAVVLMPWVYLAVWLPFFVLVLGRRWLSS
jgi:hypothetical protein